ncbi:MAG: hypothetical protein JWR44_3434 [Hymenobacter sp.]|jgi:nucleotide-binding universal stress UspA family protein|nr:hypothetical protein [Hymenobacter sp.]
MNSTVLVLANFPEAAEHTARVAAALAAPLHLPLVLLHLDVYPVMLEAELVAASAEQMARNEAETMTTLRALARRLPGSTQVAESAGILCDAVESAVEHYHPLLLVMGLSPEHDLLDHWLHNQVLPVLRATHRPLLLVPENYSPAASGPPRRVLLALDAEPFRLSVAANALVPLLAAWQAAFTVAHVVTGQEPDANPGRMAMVDVRASGLLPPDAPLFLYQEPHEKPAAGVLQAIADTQADVVVLIARPRNFLGRLFHSSVTAEVLRHSPVPVLLVPVEAPEMPGWMPAMS